MNLVPSQRKARLILAISLVGAALTQGACAQQVLKPTSQLSVDTGSPSPDPQETLFSGAACDWVDGKRTSCLLIGDELRYAQIFSFDDKKLTLGKQIYLLPKLDPKDGAKFKEADAEGVAFDGDYFYLVGSHGLSKNGDFQPSRYFTYRIKVDPTAGLPGDYGSKDQASQSVERSSVLADQIDHSLAFSLPVVPPLECGVTPKSNGMRPTQLAPTENGVNIEGVAVSNNQLYVGFRGPIATGGAFIGALPVKSAFEGGTDPLIMTQVDLGPCQGIRDIAAVNGGLFILSGPTARTSGPAAIFLWKIGAEPKLVGNIRQTWSGQAQPEGLLVTAETDDRYSILITQDGDNSQPPMTYDVFQASQIRLTDAQLGEVSSKIRSKG